MASCKLVFAACLAGMGLLIGGELRADTIYTYTGISANTLNGTGAMSITLDTTLTGAALDNLAPGTDITASVHALTMTDGGPPPMDLAAFPSADFQLTAPPGAAPLPPSVVKIGTDASGSITSWSINLPYFISFPAFDGEDPADFYAEYNIVSSNTGDQTVLLVDGDDGFSPGSSPLAATGNWGAGVVSTPEPASLSVLGLGLLGLTLRKRRR